MIKRMETTFVMVLGVLHASMGIGIVSVFPEGEVVSYINGSFSFFCFPINLNDGIASIDWFVSRTAVDSNSGDVTVEFTGRIGALTLTNISTTFNNTHIQCEAELTSGEVITSNAATFLLLQGRLSPVSNLKLTTSNTTLSLTWEPPFTLDITSVDPDISGYYVEVVAVNLLTSSEIYSEYDINGTEFSYPIPQDAGCDIYFFTITAVNIVGMGEAATTPPYHRPLDTDLVVHEVKCIDVPSNDVNDDHFVFQIELSAPVCDVTLISFINNYTAIWMPDLGDITFTFNKGIFIDLSTTRLAFYQRYIATFVASNMADSEVLNATINTHPIRDVTLDVRSIEIIVRASYYMHVHETGVMCVFVSSTGQTALVALNRTQSVNYLLPFGLSSGRYAVLAYDIGRDGLLPLPLGNVLYPAVTEELDISGSRQGQPFQSEYVHLEDCRIRPELLHIIVDCGYSSTSLATGFQVAVHAMNQSNELYVTQTTMDRSTSASVMVNSTGQYMISVFAILDATGITGLPVEHVTSLMLINPNTPSGGGSPGEVIAVGLGVVGAIIILILLALMVLVVILYLRRRTRACWHQKYDVGYDEQQSHNAERKYSPINTEEEELSWIPSTTTSDSAKTVDTRCVQTKVIAETELSIPFPVDFDTSEHSDISSTDYETAKEEDKDGNAATDDTVSIERAVESEFERNNLAGNEDNIPTMVTDHRQADEITFVPTQASCRDDSPPMVVCPCTTVAKYTPVHVVRSAGMEQEIGTSEPPNFNESLGSSTSVNTLEQGSSETVVKPLPAVNVQLNVLSVSLQHDLSMMADKLNARSVLSADVLEATRYTARDRTVSIFMDRIRFEPHGFTELVKIFESDPSLRPRAKELERCHKDCHTVGWSYGKTSSSGNMHQHIVICPTEETSGSRGKLQWRKQKENSVEESVLPRARLSTHNPERDYI